MDGGENPNDRRWQILAVLCLSVLLVVMDNTIVNVTLPTIARDLNASTSALQWVVDAYTLVFAGLLLVGGNLGDRLGRRRMLQAGLVLFAMSSAGAALAGSSGELIAARSAMGVAAALIYPATLAILNNVFTVARERATAIGIWAGVSGLAIAIGPVTGGALLLRFSWSSVFYINVPIALGAIVVGRLLLPESRDPRAGRYDPIGALLSVTGITLLTWSIIQGPRQGWESDATLGGMAGAAVLLVFFAWHQLRRPDPMLDVRLFRNPRFTAASGAIALAFLALFGFMFLITQYFQSVRGYDPFKAGAASLPVAILIAVISPLAVMIMKRIGTKVVVAAGLAMMSASFLVVLIIPTDADYWREITIMMTLLGAGLAMTSGPATEAVMGALPPTKAGAGSAVNDTTRQLGGTLGVAIMGSVLNSAYGHTVLTALTRLGAPRAVGSIASQSVMAGVTAAGRFPRAVRAAASDDVRQAFMTGYHRGALVALAVTGVAAIGALVFVPARPRPAQGAGARTPHSPSAEDRQEGPLSSLPSPPGTGGV